MKSILLKAIKNPRRAIAHAKYKIYSKVGQNEFVGSIDNRSASDAGPYVASVQNAISNYGSFLRFKRDPRYQAILEHTSKDQGEAYLEIINKETPSFIDCIEVFKDNDRIGGAVTYQYKGVGQISPSTLRYIKVASDLKYLFGNSISGRIAEIGVGYGGQLLILDKVFRFSQYDLFDLPPVLVLASKYLEAHVLNSAYNATTLNQCVGNVEYELVVSNYAFSELPSKLQMRYLSKVISKSKRGYMIMNSGKEDSVYRVDKMQLSELQKHLPPFQVIDERPLTAAGNYVIVWGADRS
jgi:putative sugar O-methyltransferase